MVTIASLGFSSLRLSKRPRGGPSPRSFCFVLWVLGSPVPGSWIPLPPPPQWGGLGQLVGSDNSGCARLGGSKVPLISGWFKRKLPSWSSSSVGIAALLAPLFLLARANLVIGTFPTGREGVGVEGRPQPRPPAPAPGASRAARGPRWSLVVGKLRKLLRAAGVPGKLLKDEPHPTPRECSNAAPAPLEGLGT